MKRVFNKRMTAIIIITVIMSVFFGMMAIVITSDAIMKSAIESAPYEFNGIYGGLGGKVLDLIGHVPEYGWLADIKTIGDTAMAAVMPFGILIVYAVAVLEDWFKPSPNEQQ